MRGKKSFQKIGTLIGSLFSNKMQTFDIKHCTFYVISAVVFCRGRIKLLLLLLLLLSNKLKYEAGQNLSERPIENCLFQLVTPNSVQEKGKTSEAQIFSFLQKSRLITKDTDPVLIY